MGSLETETIPSGSSGEEFSGNVPSVQKKITEKSRDEESQHRETPDVFAILKGEVAPPLPSTPVNKDDIQPFQKKFKPQDEETSFSSSKPKATLKIEDTFWSAKRALIPDISVFKHIEEHALAAPDELRSSPEDLARYLVEPANSELERLRAIWWWVTHNISYDVSYLNNGTQAAVEPGEVLLTGKSICQGYADLCLKLLSLAGVTCEMISGASRSADYWPGCHQLDPDRKYGMAHAWNKVKLGNEWYLFDSTWGAGGTSIRSDGLKEFNFTYREEWFLSNPDGFMSTHLPIIGGYDDNNPDGPYQVQVDQQFFTNPQTSLEAWKAQTYEDPGNVTLGFRPESHTNSIIYTNDNEVKLTFTTEKTMQLSANFRHAMGSKGNSDYRDHVIIAHRNGGVSVIARAPEAGTYVLNILGYPADLEEEKVPTNVMVSFTYTIVAEGDQSHQPFPQAATVLGQWPGCHVDFQIIQPQEPYIEATDGKATITIAAKEEILAHFAAFFTTPGGATHHAEYIYMERIGDRAKVHVTCPQEGIHTVKLQVHYMKDKCEPVAVFLVNCAHALNPQDKYPKLADGYGPRPLLYKHGVSVISPNSSTIIAPEGQCEITFRLDHPMEYMCNISDETGTKVGNGQIYLEVHGDQLTLHTRIKTTGLYLMRMIFRERGDTDWGLMKASFLLVVPTPCQLSSFPDHFGCGQANWWCDLYHDGLQYEGGYKSTLHVHQSKFDLRFRVNPDVTIIAKLDPGDAGVIQPATDGDVAVLNVTLPEPGEYTLSIMKNKGGNKYAFVQHFVVNWLLPTSTA